MWDRIDKQSFEEKNTVPVSVWVDRVFSDAKIQAQANDLLTMYEERYEAVRALRDTPQSPPYHAEGFVRTHILRMVSIIYALAEGDYDIQDIEEFAREKAFIAEFEMLQETIREHAGLLLCYALFHDIAKPEVLALDAGMNSQGAVEGFIYGDRPAKKDEVELYRKLLRKHALTTGKEGTELYADFFDQYEIRCHFWDHGEKALQETYLDFRKDISERFRLSERDDRLLTLLVNKHLRVVEDFSDGVNVPRLHVLISWANKSGLDGEDVIDLFLAILLLDVSFGSVGYKEGTFFIQLDLLFNLLHSERNALPHRSEKRKEHIQEKKRREEKKRLAQVGLDAETLFEEFAIPFGPERGAFVQFLEAYMNGEPYDETYAQYCEVIDERMKTLDAL